MSKKSLICKNWPKYLLQWGVLAALIFFLSGLAAKLFPAMEPADPEAYCPMGGLQAFGTFLSRGSLPCSMSSAQIMMGIGLAIAVILFSKLFCAFLCPIGTVEDLLGKAGHSLHLRSLEIKSGSAADKLLRIIKYALLFWIAYMTISSSELFCKKLDPYYAAATGFKGEIVLWMSLASLALVIVPALFIKRFWCKYICPLGALSNTFKFYLALAGAGLVFWVLSLCGVHFSFVWPLAALCVIGYLLEIFCGRPKGQLLHVRVDQDTCTHSCYRCRKVCPYNISVPDFGDKLNFVDCTLCGECVAACPVGALGIGAAGGGKKRCGAGRYLPALLAVLFALAAYFAGERSELPTINESWGAADSLALSTLKIENLKTVKCYGSSMAFKSKMEKIRGVYGVKTYVGSHTVVIKYDPAAIDEQTLRGKVFEPSAFKVATPDPAELDSLKILTIRTDRMFDKLDLNYLGLQMRLTGKRIFGLESEYACPLIVRVYADPAEALDSGFFRSVVEKKSLDMPVHGGGVKSTPVDFVFVKMEEDQGRIATTDYLHKMFTPFKAEYKGRYPGGDSTVVLGRKEVYKDKPQYIYEIADPNYEKPIVRRNLPYLSNHISKEEGVIGLYLNLNGDYKPALQIRFADPMTEEKLWELITMDKWSITYAEDDVREEDARIKFTEKGVCRPYAYAE